MKEDYKVDPLSIKFDQTKPDGSPRKLIDSQRLNNLDWKPKVSLNEGLRRTYEWAEQFLKSYPTISN